MDFPDERTAGRVAGPTPLASGQQRPSCSASGWQKAPSRGCLGFLESKELCTAAGGWAWASGQCQEQGPGLGEVEDSSHGDWKDQEIILLQQLSAQGLPPPAAADMAPTCPRP